MSLHSIASGEGDGSLQSSEFSLCFSRVLRYNLTSFRWSCSATQFDTARMVRLRRVVLSQLDPTDVAFLPFCSTLSSSETRLESSQNVLLQGQVVRNGDGALWGWQDETQREGVPFHCFAIKWSSMNLYQLA